MSFPTYPHLKASGFEWVSEVPEHWQIEKLKHVAVLTMGQSPSSDECNEIGDGVPFLQGKAEFGALHPVPRQYSTAVTKQAQRGDILLSVRAPVGALNVADQSYGIGRGLCAITPRSVESSYLLHCLNASASQLTAVATGSTYEAVTLEQVAEIRLPTPPTEEQVAIAAFLDAELGKIDALVAEQRRLIDLLKEKRQAVISHAVTSGLNPDAAMKASGVDWLGDIPGHWTLPPLYARYHQVLGKMLDQGKMTGDHPTPYLRNADVRWDYINVEDLPIMDIKPDERARFMVRRGDLLTVEGRELGRAAIWDGDDHVVAFQKALHRLRPLNGSEHPRYLYYTLVFANGTDVFLSDQSPNEIPHLTGEQLRRYRFPKPPLDEQVAIAEWLDRETVKFDSLVVLTQRAIHLLHERRTALISAAVTGQIDVRGLVTQEMP